MGNNPKEKGHTMIEGLQVTLTGEELKTLCLERASFHRDRATFYEKQKEALPEIDEGLQEMHLSNSKKPREMMQDRIDSHHNDASEMEFIAAHLVPQGTDLSRPARSSSGHGGRDGMVGG